MRIAIMQPTYLPWAGYFNLMAAADRFVLLDDVAFSRQSWQQRNRIVQGDRLVWLTVPVLTSGRQGQNIAEVEVRDELGWRRKHLATLSDALARAPHGAAVLAMVAEVLESAPPRLAGINIALIAAIARMLGLSVTLLRSSETGCAGGRSERLLAICRSLGGTEYLSPAGAADYIGTDGVFDAAGFPVRFQSFRPAPYRPAPPILAGEFPSILDALAWIGPDATRALVEQEIA